jgi:hypothetical protein
MQSIFAKRKTFIASLKSEVFIGIVLKTFNDAKHRGIKPYFDKISEGSFPDPLGRF